MKTWQKVARRAGLWSEPKNKYCVLCNHAVTAFDPYGAGCASIPPLMRMLNIVGSDVDHWSCPNCNAHDRERHLLLYLTELDLLSRFGGADIIHFAPERRLSPVIRSLKPNSYIRADLFPSEPDITRIDMLDISLNDDSVDIIIANHVLEHVSDDRRALDELCRVLRPNGMAILQTPYSQRLHKTMEDAGIDDDQSRLLLYGQEDHVRLYGRDIFERFSNCGLRAHIRHHDDVLSRFDPIKFGVNRAEPLFLYFATD